MSSSRKRNNAKGGSENTHDDAHSSADESAPIIRYAADGSKNYNSISPSLTAHTTSAETSTRRSQGDAGTVERVHEDQQREAAERQAAEEESKESGGWRQMLERYGSVELENKGSVARDHLALERTFLAWLRTSLSFASIGIAVTQLFRLNTSITKDKNVASSPSIKLRNVGKPLGATFIGISILILLIGFHRYFEAQHYVIRGKFPASRGSILLVTGVAGALIVSSLVVILAVGTGRYEN
ncbi:hypothetical protein B0J11DRAFT_429022 [Dendryphion nanum]|uniref:DUF202 domain-containing protein n=1 Tax=Dendryphion nanum TaxID=256645 RepID=A0A9P9IVU8_9PLEO|nr:hypothetical protein B0J11DRAFT_429022 [Dendryphion nanum]